MNLPRLLFLFVLVLTSVLIAVMRKYSIYDFKNAKSAISVIGTLGILVFVFKVCKFTH